MLPRPLRLLPCLLALAVFAAPAAHADARTPATDATVTSRLLALDAARGTLTAVPRRPGRFILTLHGVHASALWFDDRPGTHQGSQRVRTMLRELFVAGEADPNAAINALVPGVGQELMGVALHAPRYDARAGTLAFRVDRLARRGAPGGPSRTDVVLPRRFGRTALLIDDCCGLASQVQVFNTTQLPLSVSVNNGVFTAVAAAAPAAMWLPGESVLGGIALSPAPGELALGENVLAVQADGAAAPTVLDVSLPPSGGLDAVQIYLFATANGFGATVVGDGSVVSSTLGG